MVESDCACNYLDELPPGKTWDDADVLAELAARPFPGPRGGRSVRPPPRQAADGPDRRPGRAVADHAAGYAKQYGVYRYPILLGTETVTIEGEKGTLRLKPAAGAGLREVRLVPPGLWPQPIDPVTFANQQFQEFFIDARVLPYDDYTHVTPERLTWDFVYAEIFRYYYLILPVMSEYLDLRDPTIWQTPTAAHYVMRMTDPKLWGYYNYMPRMRDLSKNPAATCSVPLCRAVIERHRAGR